MNRDWLWDRKLSISQAKKILGNPEDKKFILLAALLLARKNEPREVFKELIEPLTFCTHWPTIKKRMGRDKWGSQRIIFWQAIYETLREKYRKKGVKLKEKREGVRDDFCKEVGGELRKIRKEKGLSQKALAEKLGISQQVISRIEKGKENISLITLKNVFRALGKKPKINF